jgi:hypothetical protein
MKKGIHEARTHGRTEARKKELPGELKEGACEQKIK